MVDLAYRIERWSGTPTPAETGWGTEDDRLSIRVLGGCSLADAGLEVSLPLGSRRLLAVLALQKRRTMPRNELAGTLWPRSSDDHAQASLRSALARLRSSTAQRAVQASALEVGLAPDVAIDLAWSEDLARRAIDPEVPTPGPAVLTAAVAAFSQELLPGWYDDWVTLETERWRQLRLHTLEILSDRLTAAGRLPEAALAALAAVQADPLRESARAALIRVHLAEGNQSEALRESARYQSVLFDALRLEPTAALLSLVQPNTR